MGRQTNAGRNAGRQENTVRLRAARLRAIIYVLLGQPETERWLERCRAWCEEQGYDLRHVIRENPTDNRKGLADGLKLLMDGKADVLVVATPDYLPDDWVPRFEVAYGGDPFAIPRPKNAVPPQSRRARPVRRADK